MAAGLEDPSVGPRSSGVFRCRATSIRATIASTRLPPSSILIRASALAWSCSNQFGSEYSGESIRFFFA